jgi:chemotaxis-related protein WspB
MLFLLFRVGKEHYALEAGRVIEVVPCVPLRAHPGTPGYVAGLFNYRGGIVPVLDLGVLAGGARCAGKLSTRIILIDYQAKDGARRVLGLIAEAVTDAIKKDASEFASAGVAAEKAPYLGKIAFDEHGMVQCVRVEQLVPADVEKLLFVEEKNESPAR